MDTKNGSSALVAYRKLAKLATAAHSARPAAGACVGRSARMNLTNLKPSNIH